MSIHQDDERAFQTIDAAVFSGDDLEYADYRERLAYFLKRWQKRLDETAPSDKLCPKCGLPMGYQNEDADGPCAIWACVGATVDGVEHRGCFNYVEVTSEEARQINPR